MNRYLRTGLAAASVGMACLQPVAADAEPISERLRVRAVAALDGDTFSLDDGREVRLAGIAAAKAVTAAAMEDPPPIVGRATNALDRLVAGMDVELALGAVRLDRHRRLLAHVYVAGPAGEGSPPLWIQGVLLQRGMARVSTTLDTRQMAAEMLALEAEARTERHGIWALDHYRVLTPAEAADRIGGFQLVEGRVRAVAIVGSRAFLNFGDDWRTDFTVALDARARRLFRAAGVDPKTLEGRAVRARGWIQSYNGPMIEATHPELIEVLQE